MRIVRDIDAGNLAAVTDDHTKPIHLVKLEFEAETVFLADTYDVTHDGDDYIGGMCKVSDLSWDGAGSQSCTIEIMNEDNFAADLVLGNSFAGATATVWLVHRKHDNTFTDPVLYVIGGCDDAELVPAGARFVVVATKYRTEHVPNRYFTQANGFNFLPPENVVITWNGNRYLLQGIIHG